MPFFTQKTSDSAFESRRKNPVRLFSNPQTTDRMYDSDEMEFIQAMYDYRIRGRRPFPTWSEALEVCKSLGYRKVADPIPIDMKSKRNPK